MSLPAVRVSIRVGHYEADIREDGTIAQHMPPQKPNGQAGGMDRRDLALFAQYVLAMAQHSLDMIPEDEWTSEDYNLEYVLRDRDQFSDITDESVRTTGSFRVD